MPDDRAARDLARHQHGIVGDRQADALGLGARHRMWGIPGFGLRPIHVARRYEGIRRPSRLARVHNLRGVPPAHLGEVDGIPVGSPALTCFQVAAATMSLLRTERAVDNVLAVGLAKPMAFHDLLRVLAQRGRNGTGSCGGSSRSGHPTTDLPSRATRPASSGCASATAYGCAARWRSGPKTTSSPGSTSKTSPTPTSCTGSNPPAGTARSATPGTTPTRKTS